MDSFLVGAQILLAGVFLLAGAAKLFDLKGSVQAVFDFGVPQWAAPIVGRVLPVVELATGVALLFHPTARWAALAALVLLLAFVAGVANAMRQGKDVDCGCFGAVYSATAGTPTLIRNGALAALALLVVLEGPAPAIDEWVSERSAAELVAIGATIVLVAVTGLAVWLWSRNRLLKRALEEAPTPHPDPEGLPLETAAPTFALSDKHGQLHTLESLLARGNRVVLTFMDAKCNPCKSVGPLLARWQSVFADRVTMIVVAAGPPEASGGVWDEYGIDVLFDSAEEVARAYLVRSFPSALIVEPDGRIGSTPANGGHGVEIAVRLALTGAEAPHGSGIAGPAAPTVLQVEPGTN